jgi:hypothetical protein
MKIVSILALFFFANLYSFVGFCRPQDERPISLQFSNLSKWQSSSEALAIQKSLGAHVPAGGISNQIQQIIAAKKTPFLLLETERNRFGGFFALVVFKDYPKLLRLWVYEIDKGTFEIRDAISLRNLNNPVMDALRNPGLSKFWIMPR